MLGLDIETIVVNVYVPFVCSLLPSSGTPRFIEHTKSPAEHIEPLKKEQVVCFGD